jgi:mitosis inhibitor protein kinase SWE1
MSDSPELFDLIKSMMRTNPALRVDIHTIWSHPVLCRTRAVTERISTSSRDVFGGSPLASVPDTFLREILDRPYDDGEAMDLSP